MDLRGRRPRLNVERILETCGRIYESNIMGTALQPNDAMVDEHGIYSWIQTPVMQQLDSHDSMEFAVDSEIECAR